MLVPKINGFCWVELQYVSACPIWKGDSGRERGREEGREGVSAAVGGTFAYMHACMHAHLCLYVWISTNFAYVRWYAATFLRVCLCVMHGLTSLASLKHVELFHDLNRQGIVVFIQFNLRERAYTYRARRARDKKGSERASQRVREGGISLRKCDGGEGGKKKCCRTLKSFCPA